MGTSYTYTLLTDVMNLTIGAADDITAINAEKLIDLAIDMLNLFGAELDNMSGTAGTKTISLESSEHGAVALVVRAVYYGFYKNLDQAGAPGGFSISSQDLLKDPATLQLIKDAAASLKSGQGEDSDMQVMTG